MEWDSVFHRIQIDTHPVHQPAESELSSNQLGCQEGSAPATSDESGPGRGGHQRSLGGQIDSEVTLGVVRPAKPPCKRTDRHTGDVVAQRLLIRNRIVLWW